jgi:hypothetical protein
VRTPAQSETRRKFVGEGNVCNQCSFACRTAAISKGALAAYQTVVASAPANDSGPAICECAPPAGNARCKSGHRRKRTNETKPPPNDDDAALDAALGIRHARRAR